MEIEEEARNRLARDLHDGPTQSIAAIAMRVNFAKRLFEKDPVSASQEGRLAIVFILVSTSNGARCFRIGLSGDGFRCFFAPGCTAPLSAAKGL